MKQPNREEFKGYSARALPGRGECLECHPSAGSLLKLRSPDGPGEAADRHVQRIGKGIICRTDYRPAPMSPVRIVLDATEGFIPLWAENLVLRWRFNEVSLNACEGTEELKQKIRHLLAAAITAWGDAAPIRFTEERDNSDFEIVMERRDDCDSQGCVLAQAFFPDAGRHRLLIYPRMFEQEYREQVETLTHEIGHVFGLRHFFAPETETRWPSVIFGQHRPFSIMNYGDNSTLTETDRSDLKKLYKGVWSRELTEINGTPVKLVKPFHYL